MWKQHTYASIPMRFKLRSFCSTVKIQATSQRSLSLAESLIFIKPSVTTIEIQVMGTYQRPLSLTHMVAFLWVWGGTEEPQENLSNLTGIEPGPQWSVTRPLTSRPAGQLQ